MPGPCDWLMAMLDHGDDDILQPHRLAERGW